MLHAATRAASRGDEAEEKKLRERLGKMGACLKLLFTDDNKYNCDHHDPKGKEKIPKGTMMRGCRKCDFDWCMKCYKELNPAQYEKDKERDRAQPGHGAGDKWKCLKHLITPSWKVNCDHHDRSHREKIPPGSSMWGCDECDWDCCAACLKIVNPKLFKKDFKKHEKTVHAKHMKRLNKAGGADVRTRKSIPDAGASDA